MEETIKELMEFDKNCKLIIEDLEVRESNIDEAIEEQIKLKKEEINNKYLYKINFQKTEYDKRIKQRKEEIDKETNIEIQKMQEHFENEKEKIANTIINSILKRR